MADAHAGESGASSSQPRPFDLNTVPAAEPEGGRVPNLNESPEPEAVPTQAPEAAELKIRRLREEIVHLETKVVDDLDRIEAGIWVGHFRIRRVHRMRLGQVDL